MHAAVLMSLHRIMSLTLRQSSHVTWLLCSDRRPWSIFSVTGVLKRWVVTCHLMLEAMHEYAKTKDVLLGTDRSISLVLLKSMGVAATGCKCVRCKYTDDSQDLIWVHWLNNGRRRSCS